MSQKPDYSPDSSGPYLRPRLIPKRPDPTAADAQPSSTEDATGQQQQQQPESEPPRAAAAKSHLWFEESVVVPDKFRELLVKYSHIPPEEVDEHVVRVRNRAWQVHPYPCLGQFRFLELNLSNRPGDLYPRLLSILTSPSSSSAAAAASSSSSSDGQLPSPLFLDVGTCLGQDVRQLIHDGAPPHTVAGAELSSTFIELGYQLFRDDGAEPGRTVRMVHADILAPLDGAAAAAAAAATGTANALAAFRGQLQVVQLGMILHLFSWEEQVTAFANAVQLLKDERGVLVIGQATGNVDGIETRTLSPGGKDKGTWKHNERTFEKLVRDVEAKTGTRWDVKAELDEGLSVKDGKRTWDDPRTRRLLFEIERVK